MPEDLRRRRTHSRRRSLEFAASSIAVGLSIGLLLGLLLDAVLFVPLQLLGPEFVQPGIRRLIIFPCIVAGAFALAYLAVLVWAALRSGEIVLRRASVRAPDGASEQRLANVLEELSLAAGIPCPGAAIIDDEFPNAMTAGRGRGEATVAVTTGLLETLSRSELQAVAAHEVAHIVDGDIRFMTFMAVNASWLREALTLAESYSWLLLGFVLWPTVLLARWALTVAQRGASRERELLADDTAVALTRDPDALVSALTTIGSTMARPSRAESHISMLFIVDPMHTWSGGDSPPLRERIERLRQLSPSSAGPAADDVGPAAAEVALP